MRQRLAIAAALLGDPETLVLDEPANGLDPKGVHWLRGLIRGMAADGRTVFVSSHLLAELAQTVDDVVIIAAGRLVTQQPAELLNGTEDRSLEDVYLRLTMLDTSLPPFHQGHPMKSLVSAELLKLRTTRSLWVAAALVVVVAVTVPLVLVVSPSGVDIPELTPAALAELVWVFVVEGILPLLTRRPPSPRHSTAGANCEAFHRP